MSNDQPHVRLSQQEKQILLERLLHKRMNASRSFPMSFAQQRLWFMDRLESNSATYLLSEALLFEGGLNLCALQSSLRQIVERHDILRTTFMAHDDQFMQMVHASVPPMLSVIDLRELSHTEQDHQLQNLPIEEARYPFDLAHGPLLRTTLIRLHHERHIFLLTIHHIVSDGWSMELFFEELIAHYRAFDEKIPSLLAPLPIQYADFTLWQYRWLHGATLEMQLSYWKHALAGAIPTLALPTDRPRPPVQRYRGSTLTFCFPEALSYQVRTFSRQEDVTPFITLLSTFATLLFRFSGQEDLLVGSPIANRTRVETEKLIGLFANTLVLRIRPRADISFRDLLKEVRKAALEAHTYQDLPFERLVEELQPQRDTSRNPLFQVLFSMQNTLQSNLALPHVNVQRLPVVDRGIAKFDLLLSLEEREQQLHGLVQYNTDLFDNTTIDQMIDSYLILTESALAHADVLLIDLPLLSAAGYHKMVVEWNANAYSIPHDIYLHQQIEVQTQKTPDAIALVFEESSLTYAMLNARANQLAQYLRSLGVGPDVPVGIAMERSLNLVIGLLGILKAGGAYVPLDLSYPTERLLFMIEDTQASMLLTDNHECPLALPQKTHWIDLQRDKEILATQSMENPISGVTMENLAYIIYTSGSTGKPKGVMNTHGGIYNRLLWMQNAYQLTRTDCVLQKTPFSFDVSVWEFFWPLLVGARLVLAKPGGQRDSSYLARLIIRQQITTLHFVPSMLQVFLQDRSCEKCSSIKRVICSGEALPYKLQKDFFAHLHAELHNLYGPTEAAIDVTSWACKSDTERKTVPIGRPIANTQVYVLDALLHPLPVGVPGELYIGGVGLARGYFQRPDLTAERFTPDPFSTLPGARLFKTADRVRYLSSGNIEFLERMDHQVKIRGFRVEPGEIEAHVTQFPQVRECVVIVREDQSGDKRLIAYIVPLHKAHFMHNELRDFLHQRLPDYMLPSVFVPLDRLPLTVNGKLDRQALPAPDLKSLMIDNSYSSPQTKMERTVASLWQEVLRIDRVGKYSHFFDLGGHSLLLLQVHHRLENALQREIPVLELFKWPTVDALARYLCQDNKGIEAIPTDAAEEGLQQTGRNRLAQRRKRLQ